MHLARSLRALEWESAASEFDTGFRAGRDPSRAPWARSLWAHLVWAEAESSTLRQQPLSGRRTRVDSVSFGVSPCGIGDSDHRPGRAHHRDGRGHARTADAGDQSDPGRRGDGQGDGRHDPRVAGERGNVDPDRYAQYRQHARGAHPRVGDHAAQPDPWTVRGRDESADDIHRCGVFQDGVPEDGARSARTARTISVSSGMRITVPRPSHARCPRPVAGPRPCRPGPGAPGLAPTVPDCGTGSCSRTGR